jgi:hypothetical protein
MVHPGGRESLLPSTGLLARTASYFTDFTDFTDLKDLKDLKDFTDFLLGLAQSCTHQSQTIPDGPGLPVKNVTAYCVERVR